MQACVLLSKMNHIEDWTEARRQVATWYREAFAGADLMLPHEHESMRHVYHLFVIRHPERDALMQHLADQKIFAGVHYPRPLFTAEPFRDSVTVPFELPVCSSIAGEILSLPMYPEMTRQHVERVAVAVQSFAPASVV